VKGKREDALGKGNTKDRRGTQDQGNMLKKPVQKLRDDQDMADHKKKQGRKSGCPSADEGSRGKT